MTTYTSYDEVGVKEDVSDVITNISPTKTPFQGSIRSTPIHQKKHDWQEDALGDAAANAQVEGADAPAASATPTSLRSNYSQILSKTVKVSGTADATEAHGRAKESAYQLSLRMEEIKRDRERAFVGVSNNYTVGDVNTARVMASAPFMIDSGNVIDAATNPLAESNVLDGMSALYTAGGEASILQVKPGDAKVVADFAQSGGGRQRVLNDDAKTVTNVVNVYVSPWGTVKVVMNRFQLTTIALLYDPAYWRILTLRNWFRETLAKTGDSLNMQIIGEFSLKHTNFKASAKIIGLT